MLNGGRGYSGGGDDFCSAPRARRGGAGCNGLSWDLVFRALPGATGGGSGAPTTRWDGGNRQVPPGKSHRAGRILTTNDIFGLRRRGTQLPFSFAYFLADLPVYSTADLPTKCPTKKVPHQGSALHQGGGGGCSVGGGSDGCSCAHSTFYCSLVGPGRGSVSPPVTTSPLTPAVCSSMCSVL